MFDTTEEAIVKWNIDRQMQNEEPTDYGVVYCILEELFEYLGLEDKDCKKLAGTYAKFMIQEAASFDAVATEAQKIDALCDINVFSDGFILRHGHEPIIAMTETIKEINTRVGSFDESNGKWKKDKSDEAKANWYIADRKISKMQRQ